MTTRTGAGRRAAPDTTRACVCARGQGESGIARKSGAPDATEGANARDVSNTVGGADRCAGAGLGWTGQKAQCERAYENKPAPRPRSQGCS